MIDITISDKRWKTILPNYRKLMNAALKTITKNCPKIDGDISVLLANDAEVRELNREYRYKDKPTNVLSFPQDEPGLLGDIAMALETLEREAEEAGKTLENHFTHLFIHGVLHLAGYDHETDEEQQEMEELETELLAALGIPDPY